MNPALIAVAQNPLIISRGLVGYWSLRDGSGTIARDFSGNNNNGTVPSSSTGSNQIWSPSGKVGGCLDVATNGISVYGSGPYSYAVNFASPTSGAGDFSAFAWIFPVSSGGRRGILSWGGNGTADGTNLYVNSSNLLAFDLSNVGGPTSAATISETWTHVGVINSGGSVQLYVNGTVSGSPVSMSPTINNTYPGQIGGDLLPSFFNGYVSEVRVYNRA